MGADRTALAMKYAPGDQVLVSRVTGGPLPVPRLCTILGPSPRSHLYAYEVDWGSIGRVHVREDWLVPAEMVIEEVADTPWD